MLGSRACWHFLLLKKNQFSIVQKQFVAVGGGGERGSSTCWPVVAPASLRYPGPAGVGVPCSSAPWPFGYFTPFFFPNGDFKCINSLAVKDKVPSPAQTAAFKRCCLIRL